MRPALILLLCVAAAVVYGVVHDQITARVCVEYFTVGHPPAFDTDSPTLLGLGWGVAATWWVGLTLGLALAVAARAGRRPKRSVRSLVRPVLTLLAVTAVMAAAAGVAGYVLGKSGTIVLSRSITDRLPREKWAAFQADAFAHVASYWVGFVGGSMQIAVVWASRKWLRPDRRPAPGAG
jgi:H+/Cl- antiporter ClcA